jgi:hypothetical protein
VGQDSWQGLRISPTGSNFRRALTIECGAKFPQLTQFADFSLLALRLMVGLVFITSGWSQVTKFDERSKSIGTSKALPFFLE